MLVFILCPYITIPKVKLASEAPLKGSPKDSPDTPDGAVYIEEILPC
jgi:hypothetical protein